MVFGKLPKTPATVYYTL